MRSGTIAFLIGSLVGLQQASRPDPLFVQFIPLLLILALNRALRIPALVAVGYLYLVLRAGMLPAPGLPAGWEGRDLEVRGTVASLVSRAGGRARFELEVEAAAVAGAPASRPGEKYALGRIRLSWYRDAPALAPGEVWTLTVRLKRPHGFMNPGGFDYEGWLFRRGVRAVGYVRPKEPYLRHRERAGYRLARLRQVLSDRLDEELEGRPYIGIVKALTVGIREDITPAQWAVLRRTGTAHLVAISGLHIGLVAGLVFLVTRVFWAAIGRSVLLVPAPTVAAVLAMVAAFGYAALAGFSVPTQRALVMVVVAMSALAARRRTAPSDGLAWALLLVLLIDPFAPGSGGFWLSFVAVAVLIYGFSARTGPAAWGWRWFGAQWLIAIGLMPLTLYLFQEGPIAGPFVNAVAVPWTGLLVVPPLLLGAVASLVGLELGGLPIRFGHGTIEVMWRLLQWASDLGLLYSGPGRPDPWRVVLAGIGALWLLAPRGVPGRLVGAVYLLPLLLAAPSRPPPGDAWFTLLDVGQGTAAVLQTRNRTLVFDTGPRFSPGFDAGGAVLLPYLRRSGIPRVDTLVLSHGNSDHVGGAATLIAGIPVATAFSGMPVPGIRAEPCRDGTGWRWDGVEFKFLHPSRAATGSGNDRSCVLRVRAAGGTVLLAGDIEAAGEAALLARHPDGVAADILVVPHHGSKTSSTPAFVRAVGADYALLPVGYRNRYRFPHPSVVTRYARSGAKLLDTGSLGAITFRLSAKTGISPPAAYRITHRRFWRDGAGDAR